MNTATTTPTIVLSRNQIAVLTHAIDHTQGKIEWFPENIKGGARQKVIEALFTRALIIGHDGDWIVTAEAYTALGRPHPEAPAPEKAVKPARKTARKAAKQTPDAATSGEGEAPAPRTRENSKQAQVIAMLKRPEGATIQQVCDATDWQAHTVRGTFAGAFKKKLGLTITSDKAEGGVRVYRIAEDAPTA